MYTIPFTDSDVETILHVIDKRFKNLIVDPKASEVSSLLKNMLSHMKSSNTQKPKDPKAPVVKVNTEIIEKVERTIKALDAKTHKVVQKKLDDR